MIQFMPLIDHSGFSEENELMVVVGMKAYYRGAQWSREKMVVVWTIVVVVGLVRSGLIEGRVWM